MMEGLELNLDGLLDLDGIPDASTIAPQSMMHSGHPFQQQQQQQQQQQPQQYHHHPLSAAPPIEDELFHKPSASQRSKVIPQRRLPKVAIPRLHRGLEVPPPVVSPVAEEKTRVSHACEPCRHRKTKCSGERPTCKHCEECDIACVYADRKRERTKKEVGVLAKRIDEYEKVLRGLTLRVDGNDQKLIRKALEHEFPSEDDETLSRLSSKRRTGSPSTTPGGAGREMNPRGDREIDGGVDDEVYSEGDDERHILTRVGSTKSMDHVNEDFNRTAASRATGFMGKNSELSWMQRLKKEADVGPGATEEAMPMSDYASVYGSPQHLINESTYHCDDLSMPVLHQVEPYEVPPRQIADLLFERYLDTVHPTFPIIGKTTFLDQYRTYYTKNVRAGANWLAILNLIFAIGAKYSRLIQADWGGEAGDDMIYFTRARLLGFNTESMLDHAGLQRVQIAGLMAFYLSSINQINRAWTFSGIAVRHACTLGLNLQNNSKTVSDSSKEIRHRVWWAICSVDFRLAVMTGRPSAFVNADSTVPLPRPDEEESFFLRGNSAFQNHEVQLHPRYSSQESPYQDKTPLNRSSSSPTKIKVSPTESLGPAFPPSPIPASQALYFLLQTKLGLVTNEVLDQLYRPRVVTRSWGHVQLIISALAAKLDQWQASLPPLFDFSKKQRDQQFSSQRMCLGFFFYSTVMIISRPCLCRINRTMPYASGKSKEFNRATAARCVHAAKDMLDLLPNEPNPIGVYKLAPWWCLVHHLVQAATISMLELSFQADHVPEEVDRILQSAKKAVHWLRSMAEEDLAASRAWRLCGDMLHKVAFMVGRPLDGFPDESWPDSASMTGGGGGDSGDEGDSGVGGGSSFDYPYFTSSAGPDGAANLGDNFDPFHPTEGSHHEGLPLQAQIYTCYDEFFPPSLHPSAMTAPESPSDFLSMFPNPNQVEGLVTGDVDNLSMTRDDLGRS